MAVRTTSRTKAAAACIIRRPGTPLREPAVYTMDRTVAINNEATRKSELDGVSRAITHVDSQMRIARFQANLLADLIEQSGIDGEAALLADIIIGRLTTTTRITSAVMDVYEVPPALRTGP